MAEKVVKENKKSFDLKNLILNGGIYLVLLLLLVLIVMKDPTFLSLLNIQNILTQSSVRIIIALGVAGLIVTQGTDLSVGRQVGMAALVSATLLQAMTNVNKVFKGLPTLPIPVVLLLVVVIGALIGLITGLIVAKLNVVPFVATMGIMLLVPPANIFCQILLQVMLLQSQSITSLSHKLLPLFPLLQRKVQHLILQL